MTQTPTRPDTGPRTDDVDEPLADDPVDPDISLDTERDAEERQRLERPRLEVSATQLAAGALAAMTAALVGARLGVAGTVVGAAVGSLVAGFAGALYSLSLQRTQLHLKTLAKVPPGTRAAIAVEMAKNARRAATPRRTARVRATPVHPTDRETTAQGAAPRRRPWKAVLVTAVATFAVTAVGVTAIELTTGQALSGGTGTTISQVRDNGGSAPAEQDPAPVQQPLVEEPTEVPSEQPTTPSEPDTETPTETPTEDPTTDPEPTPTPEPTPDPTEPPTETPTPDPIEQPTP